MAANLDLQPLPPTSRWWAMLGIGLGVFMATLDASIVNISLPTLVDYFDTNFATIQWVVLSYVLVLTSLMLGVARLGDIHGKKRLYTAGVGLFTVSSLLCGLSPGVGWLIGFRALQGLGAVMMQALGVAIIAEVFPSSERGRALGIIGSIVSVGIALGPPTGGMLIGLVGWRSIFLVNVPVGIATALVTLRFVPASPPGRPGQRFDMVGALILLITLASYALGMTLGQRWSFGNSRVLALLAVAAVGLIVFLVIETRVRQPMMQLGLFRNLLFSLNLLMAFLVFVVLAGSFIMPFFLELVQGYPTQQVGFLLMAMPVVMGLVSPGAGTLSDRYGSRGISLIGLIIVVGGCLAISTLHAGVTPLGFVLRLTILGAGMGMFQSPNNSAIMGAVPREHLGIASGLLALSRTLGQTSGMPLMGALFTAQVLVAGGLSAGTDVTAAPAAALVSGVTGTYRVAAYIVLASTTLASMALWLDRRRRPVVGEPVTGGAVPQGRQ